MNKTVKGHLFAFFSVLIWGTTFVSTKILLESFRSIEILFIRFVLGFLALLIADPKRMKTENWKEEGLYLLAGLSGVTCYYFMENVALTFSAASNVGVIVSCAPLFTAVLMFFFFREEKPQGSFFLGFVFAMLGIVLISIQGGDRLHFNPVGDILAVIAAFWWGIYSVVMKKITEYKRSMVAVTKRIFFWGIVFMIPMLFLMGFKPSAAALMEPVNMGNFLFLGLGASALCFASWNRAVEELGAVKSSVYIYLTPVVTLISAYFILGERITKAGAAGTMFTLAGLVLSQKKEGKRKHENRKEFCA